MNECRGGARAARVPVLPSIHESGGLSVSGPAPRPRPRLARWWDPFRCLPVLAAFTGIDRIRAAVGCRTSAMLMLARKP